MVILVVLLKTLLGGTSKIWAGTYTGTAKELSLTGHTHSEYALISHNHNTLYYTKSEVDNLIKSTSGPTLVWNGNIEGTSNRINIITLVNNIPSTVDYIEYTDYIYPDRQKIKILRGSTVSVGAIYEGHELTTDDIVFSGTTIKFAYEHASYYVNGYGEGYST